MLSGRRAIACAVVPLLLFGACGSDPEASPDEPDTSEELSQEEKKALDLVAGSGERLLDEETARVSIETSAPMPPEAGSGVMTGRGHGAVDFEAKTASMTITMSQEALGHMNLKMIMDFPLMYMNMTDMFRKLGQPMPPEMEPWIRMNLNEIGEQVGIDLGALMRFGQSDASSYAMYTQGVVEVEEVGREDVRGKSATHYSSTVDFNKMLEGDLPEDVRSSLEVMVRLMGTSRIPMDIWLDSQERFVRQRMEMPVPVGTTGETMTMTTDYTYFGFGREVAIDPPPEANVMDFEELLELTPGSGTPGSEGTVDTGA